MKNEEKSMDAVAEIAYRLDDRFTFIDWEKSYNNEELAEVCDKLRDKPSRYGDQNVLTVERDKYGKLVPRIADDELSGNIIMALFVQLFNWNLRLPDEEKVYLHLTRSLCGFNNGEIRLPYTAVSLVFPTAEQKYNSLFVPLRSPDFVVEICRHSNRNELVRKIKESYLVEGTNTAVVLLICWTLSGNEIIVELEFYVCNIDEPVLGPIWRDWRAEEIPELAKIIPGFSFDCQLVMDRFQRRR